MEIEVLASGSGGNCYRITHDSSPLLLEAGIPFRQIQKALNFRVSGLEAVLISHSHNDHSKGTADLVKAGVDIFVTETTAQEIGISGHRVRLVRPLEQFTVGPWTILPFPLEHDVENMGFLLAADGEKLAYLTDTCYCRYRFQGLTHLILEVNYAADILAANVQNGDVSHDLRNRIVRSHMSLETAKEFLRANDLNKVREIWLCHLSSDNSHATRFQSEVRALTGKPTFVAG